MRKLPKDQAAILLSSVLLISLGLFSWVLLSESPGSVEEGMGKGGDAVPATIPIRVDPTVELFSVIYRLADINQYNERELPRYVEEVEEYFGDFREHLAVQVAKDLNRTYAINGNAPMDLAVRVTNPPDLKLRTPVAQALGDMDSRWDAEIIPVLMEAAQAFSEDTDFMAFFQAQRPFYEGAVESLRTTLAGTDMLPWFGKFFGGIPEQYVLILGLLNGSCNYGSRVTHPDGTMEFYSMLGAIDPDGNGTPRYAQSRFIPTIVHEFSHSYINPLVDRHAEALRPSGEAIFVHLQEAMHYWGYNHWYVMYYEYLVRAATIRYLDANEGAGAARRKARQDEGDTFPGVGDLADILGEYEAHRDQYPDLDAFMPRVLEFFEELAKGIQGLATT